MLTNYIKSSEKSNVCLLSSMLDNISPLPKRSVGSHLSKDVRRELCNAREEMDNDNHPYDTTNQCVATIRLGKDVIKDPDLPTPNSAGIQHSKLLQKMVHRAKASVELLVEELVLYFGKTEFEEYCKEEWPDHGSTFFCEKESLVRRFDTDLRKALWDTYMVGRNTGIESGHSVLRSLYGTDPFSSDVYNFEMEKEEKLLKPYGDSGDTNKLKLKIWVQSPSMRGREHTSMIFQLGRFLNSIVCGIQEILQHKMDLLTADSVEATRDALKQLQPKADYLRHMVQGAVTGAYEIGKHDGFEIGQTRMKEIYREQGFHMDRKFYTVVPEKDGPSISVDLDSRSKCRCGQCFACISSLTSSYQSSVQKKFQSAKDLLERVEDEYIAERERKRIRLVKEKVHGNKRARNY